jgi:hypothetical protein
MDLLKQLIIACGIIYNLILFIWFEFYYLPCCRNDRVSYVQASTLHTSHAALYVPQDAPEASNTNQDKRPQIIIL